MGEELVKLPLTSVPVEFWYAAGLAVLVILVAYLLRFTQTWEKREIPMDERARRIHARWLIACEIVGPVDRLRDTGQITTAEWEDTLIRLENALEINGVRPKHFELLKSEIKERRTNGQHKPVNLPDNNKHLAEEISLASMLRRYRTAV